MIRGEQIAQILPHRYPFLLVDRILEVEPGQRVRGLKNVTFNEPFFQGHFPGQPIMPGVLILEVMSQVGGFVFLPPGEDSTVYTRGYVVGFNRVRFRRFVVPGDTLIVEAELMGRMRNLAQLKAVARVEDQMVAKAQISYRLE